MRPAYAHIQATTSLNVRVWQMHGRHKSQNTVAPAPHWRSVFPEYNNITAATNRKEDTQVSNLFQNVEQELGVGKCGWNNFAMRCVFFTLIFVFSSLHISCDSRFWWPEHQPSDVNWSTFICHIYKFMNNVDDHTPCTCNAQHLSLFLCNDNSNSTKRMNRDLSYKHIVNSKNYFPTDKQHVQTFQ